MHALCGPSYQKSDTFFFQQRRSLTYASNKYRYLPKKAVGHSWIGTSKNKMFVMFLGCFRLSSELQSVVLNFVGVLLYSNTVRISSTIVAAAVERFYRSLFSNACKRPQKDQKYTTLELNVSLMALRHCYHTRSKTSQAACFLCFDNFSLQVVVALIWQKRDG